MQNTNLSSYEKSCLSFLQEENIEIVDSYSKSVIKEKENGIYACVQISTLNFFPAPQITKTLSKKIINDAYIINPKFAQSVQKRLANLENSFREKMHFDFVLLKVQDHEIVDQHFIEIPGEQHQNDNCFGIKTTTESIISDSIKHNLWKTEIIDLENVKYNFSRSFAKFKSKKITPKRSIA